MIDPIKQYNEEYQKMAKEGEEMADNIEKLKREYIADEGTFYEFLDNMDEEQKAALWRRTNNRIGIGNRLYIFFDEYCQMKAEREYEDHQG